MKRIERILVPTDFSAYAGEALQYALDLARQEGACIHLLHVFMSYDPLLYGAVAEMPESAVVQERMVEVVDRHLEATISRVAAAGVALRGVKRRSMAVAPTIMEYAAEEQVDLIVMGTHGRRGMRHLLLGSVAEEVVHHAGCHVTTVRALDTPRTFTRALRRILVPVDFSGYSLPLLQEARALAQRHDAALHLLHVVESTPLPVFWVGFGTVYDLVADVAHQARAHLVRLAAEVGPDAAGAVLHVAEGPVAPTIVDCAGEQEVDLIVLARHGARGLERLFMGSVTDRVVRTACCPVLILHGLQPADPVPTSAAQTRQGGSS